MKKQILSVALALFTFVGLNAQLINDNFDAYELGALGPQASHWTTWSGTEGGAEDGIVTDEYANTGANCMVIEEGGAQDVILLTGDLSSGRYSLSWNTFFDDDQATGFYNFQGDSVIGNTFVIQCFFNQDGTNTLVASYDNSDATYSFPLEEWFNIRHIVDLDNDVMHILMNGNVVASNIPYVGNLSSIDFFSIDDANRMYIDDVLLEEMPSVSACDATDLLYCENFDTYLAGSALGPWSAEWTTWSGTEGGDEDGILSTEQAASGANSLLIAEGGAQDVVVLLGDHVTGSYDVTFKAYVPAGATGFYNFQGDSVIGVDFVQQIFLNNGGTAAGTLDLDGAGTATYPEDTWFELKHIINLDAGTLELFIDGTSVYTGDYTSDGGTHLSSMDFFSIDANNRLYIDDFTVAEVESPTIGTPCDLGDLVLCDNFDGYFSGTTTGPQADHWSTWSGTLGGAEDGIVSNEQAASAPNSMLIQEGGAQDVVLLLGDVATGSHVLSWNMFIPTGFTAYYNFQGSPEIGVDFVQEILFNTDSINPGIVSFGDQTGSYPENQWFSVVHTIDLDADMMTVSIDGTTVFDGAYSGDIGNLSSVDFYSLGAVNKYFIDDITFDNIIVGIAELSIRDLNIYPNPNNGQFTIVNDDQAGAYTLRVMDLTGRTVMNEVITLGEGASTQVDLKNVNAGVYLVQLVDENNATVRIVKMIVE